jgi:hypothetical protein
MGGRIGRVGFRYMSDAIYVPELRLLVLPMAREVGSVIPVVVG